MRKANVPPSPACSKPTEISSTELRANVREILERAKYRGERFVVCTHGQPMAVVLGVEEYSFLELGEAYGSKDTASI